MILLGIDPGFKTAGFAVIKKEQNKSYLLDYGFLSLKADDSLTKRIGIFYNFFNQKISQFKVTDIALETPFLGKNAQNFLKLGYLRGIVHLLSDTYSLKLHEFSPREIKLSVTGFGGADKEQVARVVGMLFPSLGKIQKADVTDALAITVCGLWKNKREQ